jgi:hypothetical protein
VNTFDEILEVIGKIQTLRKKGKERRFVTYVQILLEVFPSWLHVWRRRARACGAAL